MKRIVAPVLSLLAAGCGQAPASGPIDVTVIGAPLVALRSGLVDTMPGAPAAALIGATRQGLIRFDATGQVIPGLAARWIVSDDGRSLIFRLADAGDPTAAAMIVHRLRAAVLPNSRNPLKPLLGAIGAIDAVTPQVVDIELTAPRPNILALFAQPELGVASDRGEGGPFVLMRLTAGVALLRRRPDPDRDPDESAPAPLIVRLRGESAARAVARFAAGRAALVSGGGFADLPIARAAGSASGQLRFDPAPGLFGLAFSSAPTGLTADAGLRDALAMAIDRTRIGHAIDSPDWTAATAIVPPGTPELPQPATPPWSAAALADRQATARQRVIDWIAAGHAMVPLRVAMPAGPGARLVFALIAADWQAIGVSAIAVGAGDDAELRLIDAVAPADTAAFYLRSFACDHAVPCTPASDRTLIAARVTPSLAERSVLLTQADALIATTVPFIALGSPVRWSLVAASLDRYRDSPRAIHPLDELRTAVVR